MHLVWNLNDRQRSESRAPGLIIIIHGLSLQGTRQGHNSEVDDPWTMLVEGVNGHPDYKFQCFSPGLLKFTQYTKYFDIYDFG